MTYVFARKAIPAYALLLRSSTVGTGQGSKVASYVQSYGNSILDQRQSQRHSSIKSAGNKSGSNVFRRTTKR